LFSNNKGEIIYVGKAKNLKKRVSSYFTSGINLGDKTKILVSQIDKVQTIIVQSEIEAFLLEERLIKKYKPRYNLKLIDGKTYLLLRITVKDKYPKVLLSRKEDDKTSLYFGPYTSSSSLRTVLKLLRGIFPYQSVLHHPKYKCLYFHLGLCPCPETVSSEEYKKNIKKIIEFLEGKTDRILKSLETERNEFSKKLDFENAALVQRKIDSIELITGPFYKPFQYEENLNLKDDIVNAQLAELKQILNLKHVGVSNLFRIECYDISNTSGTNATGSMVVFTNGEKDSDSYRRFKIKLDEGKPNDFAMMQEVLQRRLKHSEWPNPGLIIVDGGKGQVSAANEIIKNTIPLVGLAKREEIIITTDLEEIKLPKNSKALHLIMRLRDEAHRFAITYHRKLRSKLFIEA